MERFNFIILILISIRTITLATICPSHQLCVPVNHCSSVNQKLYQKNLNESEINHLRSLQCGYFNNRVYVCCNSSLPQPGVCGKVGTKGRIVNGKKTRLGEFPFVVLVGRRWKETNNRTGISYECGGSLINDRYVLTAAHCVKFFSYTNYKERIKSIEVVRLGEWDTENDPDVDEEIKGEPVIEAVVEKIIPHGNYRLYKKYGDIALLRLKEKITFTKYIRPICLPQPEEEFTEDLTVIGWGKTNASNNDMEAIQRYANVDVVDNESCDEKFGRYNIQSTQICAGTSGKDSCAGDSGGPLVGFNSKNLPFYWYLAGVVSFGQKECGTIGKPGVYTDVRKFLNWIQQSIIH